MSMIMEIIKTACRDSTEKKGKGSVVYNRKILYIQYFKTCNIRHLRCLRLLKHSGRENYLYYVKFT